MRSMLTWPGRSAVQQLHPEQLCDRHELISTAPQCLNLLRQCRDRLRTVTAAVVLDHDGARMCVGHDVAVDGADSRASPVPRIDVPLDRLESKRAGQRD